MNDILWLPSWFPVRHDPFNGDFVERHARAAAQARSIVVLMVVKDPGLAPGTPPEIEDRVYGKNLRASILYYAPFSRHAWLDRLTAGWRYFSYSFQLIRRYRRQQGRPWAVHVHICWKAGLLAWLCRLFYGWPYYVSEQWSIFSPHARPSFHELPLVQRWMIRTIYRGASRCSAVSDYLAGLLAERFGIRRPAVIPNLVDTTLFRPCSASDNAHHQPFRFIHVSTLNYAKNPGQLMEAVRLLKERKEDAFVLDIYGPVQEELCERAQASEIGDLVHFRGLVSHLELSEAMRAAGALILNSRYETFGCVVIEALASGIPVIVSDIPPIREMVKERVHGLFVPPGDAEALADQMARMIQIRDQYLSGVLHTHAREGYGLEVVGKMFNRFYEEHPPAPQEGPRPGHSRPK